MRVSRVMGGHLCFSVILVAGVARRIRVTVSGTAGFTEVARSRAGQSGFA